MSGTDTIPVGKWLWNLIFRKKLPTLQQVEDASRYLARVKEQAEKTAKLQQDWEERLSKPAHEFIATTLAWLGLPSDPGLVINKHCSFWLKHPEWIYATPHIGRVVRITKKSPDLELYIEGLDNPIRCQDEYTFKMFFRNERSGIVEFDVLKFTILD